MKILNLLLVLVLAAAIGAFSIARISAQTAGPQNCPGSGHGMMNGQGGYGMMGGTQRGYGMMQGMQGMHGPADQAYMQSMQSMHQSMYGRSFTGDADRDFMTMMIPHHEAAIGMAKTELKYGKNPKLRAMARQIIEAQEAEIHQMRAMLQ